MGVPRNSATLCSYRDISVGTNDLDFRGRLLFKFQITLTNVVVVFFILSGMMSLRMSRKMRRMRVTIQMSTL